MDCEACARGLESQLKKNAGVYNVKINFSAGTGNIKFNPLIIKPERITKTLNNEGFPSTILEKKK